MTQPCPRCKERGTEGQLLKAPGDTVASCLQCRYEAVEIVSNPLPKKSTKWYCAECDKYLRGQKWFDKHMAKRHQKAVFYTGEKNEPEEIKIKLVVPTPWICVTCQKPFPTKQALSGHMATHSDRPTDPMVVLEQAEKQLRKAIMASLDGEKVKLKEARQHVLSAIEVLL